MLHVAVLLVLTVVLFITAFFPISNTVSKFANDPPSKIGNNTINLNDVYGPHVNKTVLIVIDALRWDFVTEEFMPLTLDLMRGTGCLSKVIVESPTVTLPRIKALTTGNIPQYIDVVRNLASSEILSDSWLHSAKQNNLSVIFYGDNTWEKLFPDFFTRSEGTTSFFVWDFVEVDDNVTRNVNLELEKTDWDIMVLHYLGLDHIGHVLGPFSGRITPKLKEMDEIIYKIYKTLSHAGKVAVFVTGDHGMRDSGGHGGTTVPEVTVPFISLGLHCEPSTFHQTDIPVNLATLLGINIPSSSIGNLQKLLLQNLNIKQYLFASKYNVELLLKKTDDTFECCPEAGYMHQLFLISGNKNVAEAAVERYTQCSHKITKNLFEKSSRQDMTSLFVAIMIMLNILSLLLRNLLYGRTSHEKCLPQVLFLVVIATLQFLMRSTILSCIFLLLLILSVVQIWKGVCLNVQTPNLRIFLVITVILHPLTFISTSFIEEEHYFWIYFSVTIIIYNFLNSNTNRQCSKENLIHTIAMLSLLRFCMDINSTIENSVQNTENWDNFFKNPDNCYYYYLYFVLGLASVFIVLKVYSKMNNFWNDCLTVIVLILICLLKLTPYHNSFLGKCIWTMIIIQKAIFNLYSWTPFWILASCLLIKPHNVVLIAIATYIAHQMNVFHKDTTSVILVMYIFSKSLYFLQGHRNTLASVDVSIGYTGLNDYYPILVTSQVLIHTYTFPVLFHLVSITFLASQNKNTFWTVLLTLQTYVMMFICVVTLIFRNHLFIWSVFAPKLFIESVHTCFLCVEMFIAYSFVFIKHLYKSYLKST